MEIPLPVTRTKIIIPRRRVDLLSRSRLLTQLDDLSDNRLIIVAAPAGYGKTSLLVDFVHLNQMPACWLSLDTLDSDPQRFIGHFIASIKVVFPKFGNTSLAALHGMQQDRLNLDALVSLIVNDAFDAIGEHFLIIVDDYHLVENNRDVNYFINRFLLLVDENCHLIISSRRLLPLPDMPLLVARSMVGGLGFEELAFRPDEIKKYYLQNHKLILTEQEADAFAHLTEGWITGLVLSTQVVNGKVTTRFQAKNVSGVGLYDYLAQQVLDHQSQTLKRFLYRSSLLEEYDVSLCEEVIGKALNIEEDWQSLMDAVQRNNLFVLPVVEEKIWLRYHHLFRDFLHHRILREFPEEAQAIQIRLAEYYQQRGDWERAYLIYERMGNKELMAKMLETAGAILVQSGRLLTLQTWLEQLPDPLVDKSAGLLSLQGAVKVMLGDAKEGIELLNRSIEMLPSGENILNMGLTYLRRSGAFRMVGEYRQALEDAEKAMEICESQPEMAFIRASAFHSKGLVFYYLGALNDALLWFNKAKSTFEEIGNKDSAGKAVMDIAMIYRYLGQFGAAENIYKDVLKYYQSTHNIVWQANLLNNLGVLRTLSGDYEAALRDLECAIQYARLGGYIRLESYALTSLGDLFKDIGASKEAYESYAKARRVSEKINDQFLEFYLMLVDCDLHCSRGNWKKAEELLELTRGMAEEAGSSYEQNLHHFAAGRLAYARKDYHTAKKELNAAVNYFLKEGHHVETVRGQFLLACILFLTEEKEAAIAQFNGLVTRLNNQEMTNILATAGEPLAAVIGELEIPENFSQDIKRFKLVVEKRQKRLPALRKDLRRQSQVVLLAPPELAIKTFGKIQVSIGDHIITGAEWQSQSARDLLLLLLLHPGGMSKEEIGSIFWPDASPAELKLRFKNIIYRLRHAAGKEVVEFSDEIYSFNRAMDYEVDFESFDRELVLAQRCDCIEEKIRHYSAGAQIYQGDFLPELSEDWVLAERERYFQKYLDALTRLVELYMESGRYQPALSSAERFLQSDLTDEHIHRLVMRIHALLGNLAGVVKQYDELVITLEREIGASPSLQTKTLFETLTYGHRRT